MDHICHLYEYYKSSGKGSEYLVTMYEDHLRHHWHKQCESGRRINSEVEASKTNEQSLTIAGPESIEFLKLHDYHKEGHFRQLLKQDKTTRPLPQLNKKPT